MNSGYDGKYGYSFLFSSNKEDTFTFLSDLTNSQAVKNVVNWDKETENHFLSCSAGNEIIEKEETAY